MADPKVHVPAPAIFQSDPTEQIYAKGTLDRDMSGLSFMLMNAMQGRRDADQQAYMGGVSEANRMAMELSKQEEANKFLIETLKQAPDYAKAGLPISQVPSIARHFTGAGTDPQTADASKLVNLLKQSEIAANQAKAANAGGDNVTVDTQVTPSGVGFSNVKVKGRDVDGANAKMIQAIMENLKQRGMQPKPGGALTLPTSAANAGAAQTWAAQRLGNVQ